MCFGGGGSFQFPQFNDKNGQNIIPIPAGNFVGGSPTPSGAPLIPYQQGMGTGLMGAGNLQQGMGMAQQGMNMARQNYANLGKMTEDFTANAQHSGDPNYNPGIGQFQDATRQNIQNVASALASQRGASVDPGLAARNVGQAGVAAGQQAASQLGQVSATYKAQQMANALGAASAQTQAVGQANNAAGVYGQIASAYANMGLQNQAQILQAIAAQNIAAVQMQSNINNNRTAMFGQQLGYTANIFGSQASMYNAALGAQSQANQQSNSIWGGLLGGLGAIFGLAEGGMVGRDGKPVKLAKGGSVKSVPKYAYGGRIPEKKRRKMAEGGLADGLMPGESGGIPDTVQEGPFKGKPYSDYSMAGPGDVVTGVFGPGGKQAGPTAMSRTGKFLQGFGFGVGSGQQSMPIAQSSPYGMGAPNPVSGFSRGGPVRYAMGGMTMPGQQMQGGPMLPNLALAGTPNPRVAMPPTGLPMGNAQTRGGGPMPGMGASGGANLGAQPQQQQQMQRPPGMAQGGGVGMPRSPQQMQQNQPGVITLPNGQRAMIMLLPNGEPTPNSGPNIGGANPRMREAPQWDLEVPYRRV